MLYFLLNASFKIAAMMENEQELRDRLNTETGKLEWPELERHFARGVVVKVDASLDLVDVACCVVRDDSAAMRNWMASSAIEKATDEDARAWQANQPLFWAVVVAPWVLVQAIEHSEC